MFYFYDLQMDHLTLTFWYCCKMKITLLTILKFVMVSESRRLILVEPKFLWYRHLAIPSAMNILAKPLSGIQFHGKTVQQPSYVCCICFLKEEYFENARNHQIM